MPSRISERIRIVESGEEVVGMEAMITLDPATGAISVKVSGIALPRAMEAVLKAEMESRRRQLESYATLNETLTAGSGGTA